jgi:hypothetical protein
MTPSGGMDARIQQFCLAGLAGIRMALRSGSKINYATFVLQKTCLCLASELRGGRSFLISKILCCGQLMSFILSGSASTN